MDPFFHHNGAIGTQHYRDETDVLYWTSNADIPTLPVFTGFMGTHGVYRHLTIMDQTAVMIGEAKHGLWRVHESGFIREYLRAAAATCWYANSDINPNDDLTPAQLETLKKSYSNNASIRFYSKVFKRNWC